VQPSALSERQDEFEILDVREPGEWQAGRIERSRHVRMNTIPERLAELPTDRKIVVVCRSGNRSGHVTEFLRAHGFDAENLEGGLQQWAAEGRPLTSPGGGPGYVA
jgi:rhodanese-related sulfurtransferase